MQDAIAAIEETRIVAVLRGLSVEEALPLTEALLAGGVRVVEFALDSAAVWETVKRVRAVSARELCVGVGTVLSREAVVRAEEAGAAFLFTPVIDAEVAGEALRRTMPVIMGALTPSEIYTAHRLGAAAVKVFPASRFGPEYIREVRVPLPEIRLLPTSGIDLSNAKAYLDAGAWAVGVGGWLVSRSLWGDGDFAEVKKRAKALVRALAGEGSAPPR